MFAPPKVLVVDDKHYIRQLLLTALELKGYEVLLACDGRDGFEAARRERPRVILLDLLMPGCDGLEMLRLLRSAPETAAIPVVVMSARGDMAGDLPPPGAQEWLLKPFDLGTLETVVTRYAGRGFPPGVSSLRVSASADEVAAGEDTRDE